MQLVEHVGKDTCQHVDVPERSVLRDYIGIGYGEVVVMTQTMAIYLPNDLWMFEKGEKNHPRYSPELGRTLMNLHNNEAGRRVCMAFKYNHVVYTSICLFIDGSYLGSKNSPIPPHFSAKIHLAKIFQLPLLLEAKIQLPILF